MPEASVKTVRASETVSPYGPGALVDILGQSFMVPTGDRWPSKKVCTEIHADRLASALHVQELWAAPTTPEPDKSMVPGLEFVRFPQWLFCQVCRRMVQWRRGMETGGAPVCVEAGCDGRLVPMRFVAVCTENSHVADIPWPEWMHRNVEGGACDVKDRLRFRVAEGRSEGLSSLEVSCDRCGHRRTLGDLRRDVLLREGFTCRGTQPWDTSWKECGKIIDPQQRGATSLHFTDSFSAIDIPAVEGRASELEDAVKGHVFFAAAVAARGTAMADEMALQISQHLNIPVNAVMSVLSAPSDEPDRRTVVSSLQTEEFEAFVAAIAGTAPTENFETRIERLSSFGDQATAEVARLITDVVLVDRLRDVRAVRAFRRYSPDAAAVPAVPRAEYEKSWLPAVEGYGEGIFLRFDAGAIESWGDQAEVRRLERVLLDNQNASVLGRRLHVMSGAYVLLHTFAHLLMRELAFSSGYTAASLRERVYCENPGDYGLFIYTTTSDVEGTLGGLVRQGEPDLLTTVIIRALEQAAWCPNDPVCAESEPQSIDGLNLAACHACSLAPETSCESSNLLLDRTFVVGRSQLSGFFEPVIDTLLGQRVG